jgi:hypothetical protein
LQAFERESATVANERAIALETLGLDAAEARARADREHDARMNELQRKFQADESTADREFRSAEAGRERAFQSGESVLDRASNERIAGKAAGGALSLAGATSLDDALDIYAGLAGNAPALNPGN